MFDERWRAINYEGCYLFTPVYLFKVAPLNYQFGMTKISSVNLFKRRRAKIDQQKPSDAQKDCTYKVWSLTKLAKTLSGRVDILFKARSLQSAKRGEGSEMIAI